MRVSTEAKERLDLYKREGESYEDVIVRLTESDKWTGFGVLSETEADTRAGMEQMREEMRDGLVDDVTDSR
ncbi:DUF7557 family protein [Natrialbaceae archaeon A-gly3]